MTDFISLFIFVAGLVVGLGAVTVIDLHGFLGRNSKYWTEATTRTHKVTKPLIWIGIILVTLGSFMYYSNLGNRNILIIQMALIVLLVLNGLFLSFSVSPYLLKREREGKSDEILPKTWQNKITLSFIFSFLGWWLIVAMLVYSLTFL